MTRFVDLLQRFRKDERGIFMVLFAVMGLVLIATSGAVVDFSRVQQARTKAQTALDAAALALQDTISDTGVTSETLKASAQKLIVERMADASVTVAVTSATPNITEGKLTLAASIQVPTYFVQLVGIKNISAQLLSEVTRASKDIEVAVAADITYSMLGTKLDALKSALKFTIGELVQDTQPPVAPTYSKMAIAPYSNGVNIGAYADNARGAIVAGKAITSIAWSSGVVRNVKSISQASAGLFTLTDVSSLADNNWVYISGASGMTKINGTVGQIANLNTTNKTFNLKVGAGNLNTTSGNGYSTHTANTGTVTKCTQANCLEVVTTSSAHGIADDEYVYITGTTGTSNLNDKAWQTNYLTATTYELLSSTPANGASSNGTSNCAKYGCPYQRFTADNNTTQIFVPTECAVERTTSTYASLDTAPSTAPVGIQYAPANGIYYNGGSFTLEACPTSAIQPLTSDKTVLESLVTGFNAQGSTAGHIGLAWAWYMLSPDFISGALGTQWPSASKPAAYGKTNLLKAIILMTDGEFNTMYTYGVPSKDADYVDSKNQSNTNAPVGTSLVQAANLCTEIKKSKYSTLLYTIGFNITKGSAADTSLKNCATNTSMYKTASDAATLKQAFAEIADSLSELRVSK